MRCLSFGYFLALAIAMTVLMMVMPNALSPVFNILGLMLMVYFFAGFFMKCDSVGLPWATSP